MVSRTANICVDCSDPTALALWWAEALDDFHAGDRDDWVEQEAWLTGPGGRSLIFLKVPEAKTVKNRLHLCVRPVETTRDAEVARLLELGASLVADLREPDSGWAVLADPEGNEFCVLTRSAEAAGITRG